MRTLFNRARTCAPCVLFFDEVCSSLFLRMFVNSEYYIKTQSFYFKLANYNLKLLSRMLNIRRNYPYSILPLQLFFFCVPLFTVVHFSVILSCICCNSCVLEKLFSYSISLLTACVVIRYYFLCL